MFWQYSELGGLENPYYPYCYKELNVKFAYLNFDDESLYGLTTKDLKSIEQAIYEIYGNDAGYLVFDEVHNVKGWELFISRVRETN